MRISVVVPAHNEAGEIMNCLERVIEQDGPIGEIIVVDNNSTDETPDLVQKAAICDDRVLLITERRPGVAYARYAGFAAATGDVIASIDSDTRVEPGWAAAIASAFTRYPQIAAATCPMVMFDLPFQGAFARRNRRLETRARRRLQHGHLTPATALSGANSAIRRTAWGEIASKVSYRSDVFEDLDRSILLQDAGHSVAIVPGMTATVSGRRLLSGPRGLLHYAACGPRTYALRGRRRQAAIAWVVNVLIVARSTALLPANRAWDPEHSAFSLRRLRRREWQVRHSPIG